MFNCNCKVTELIVGVVILVFALWQTSFSQWIIVIAAALLILHSFTCKNCGVPASSMASSRKKRR